MNRFVVAAAAAGACAFLARPALSVPASIGGARAHVSAAAVAMERPVAARKERFFLVGAADYATSATTAVHVFRVGADGGAEGPLSSTTAGTNPSWLCGGHRDGRAGAAASARLFACLEAVGAGNKTGRGGVAALSFHADGGGELTLTNHKAWPHDKGLNGPAHCAAPPPPRGDGSGGPRWVVAASYSLGQTVVFEADPDTGALIKANQTVQYAKGSHAHCVTFSPDGRFAFVVDLGLDVVHGYKWDAERGWLEPGHSLRLEAGTAPRHLVFSPGGGWGLLLTEKTNLLMALRYDADEGRFEPATPARTALTVPGDWNGVSFAAEVQAHPSGRHVFVSNRGHDSVAVMAFDPDTGAVRAASWHQALVSYPRGLTLAPDGDVLVVANQQGAHEGVVALSVSESGASLAVAGQLRRVESASDALFVT